MRQRQRQRDRERGRQRERERQRDRQTDRQTAASQTDRDRERGERGSGKETERDRVTESLIFYLYRAVAHYSGVLKQNILNRSTHRSTSAEHAVNVA